jgi:hypothetical protein
MTDNRVNTTTTGSQYTINNSITLLGDETAPGLQAVSTDKDGDFVVTWSSVNALGMYGVYAQRYSAAGISQGDEIQVITSTAVNGLQYANITVAKDTGDFVITWTGRDSSGTGIFAQRYNSTGVAQGSVLSVNSTTSGNQQYSTIAMDANGNFIITWTNQTVKNGYEILAQLYNKDGTKLGGEISVNDLGSTIDPAIGNQRGSIVAMNSNGDVVIAWVGSSSTNPSNRIFARQGKINWVTGEIVFQDTQFQVNTYNAIGNSQLEPSIAMDDSGNFVITWSSQNQDGSEWGIFGRRYGTNGTALDVTEFQVNSNTSNQQRYSSVSMNKDGDFIVTWSSYLQDRSNWGIYAQRFNASGARKGTEFKVNTATSGEQRFSSTAMDTDGNAIIVWTSETIIDTAPEPDVVLAGDGNGKGVFLAQFSAAENTIPTLDYPIVDQVINEDSEVSFWLPVDTFSDVDNDSLTYTATLNNGSVLPNWVTFDAINRKFRFKPNDPDVGEITIRITANDGNGGTVSDEFKVTVTPVNDAPVAVPDSNTLLEDTPVEIDILANDVDIDSPMANATVAIASGPAQGTVEFVNGKILYTPNLNQNGSDSFDYQVIDSSGASSNTVTVSINIEAVNDAPTLVADNTSTNELTPVVIRVLDNDSDIDGTINPATLAIASNPSNGTVIINGDHSLTYTPNVGFKGADSFTYTVADDTGEYSTATVNIAVSARPIAEADNSSTNEEVPVDINLVANDSDPDGTLNLSSIRVNQPAHGQVEILGNGVVRYTPNTDFAGTDTFTYTIKDNTGAESLPATVIIAVNNLNDAPIANHDGDDNSISINEDGGSIVIPVLANDTDADLGDNPLSEQAIVQINTQPQHGSLSVNVDGSIQYTPHTHYNGTDEFQYLINDGETTSNVATVKIIVNSVNDPPVAQEDITTLNEDDPSAIIDVLANDNDLDGNLIPSSVALVDQPGKGTVSVSLDGKIVYISQANEHGSDSFTYTVQDNEGGTSAVTTVNVTINPVNDAPVAIDDGNLTLDEDTAIDIDVLANDTDIDSPKQTLTVEIVDAPDHGIATVNIDGSVHYVSNDDYNGTDSFTYRLKDSDNAYSAEPHATVTLTINPINDPPRLGDDSAITDEGTSVNIDVLANDTDIDVGGSINTNTLAIASNPSNGTVAINADKSITYTPNVGFNGADSFTYTVADDKGESSTATVNVAVSARPIAGNDSTTTNEEVPVDINLVTNDSDADGSLNLSTISINQSGNGQVEILGNGVVRYTPNKDFAGTDTFTYTIKDNTGAESLPATVTIAINNLNDAPVANNDTNNNNGLSVDEDSFVDIPVLTNDIDVDADDNPLKDKVTIQITKSPSHGTLSLNSFNVDGSIRYTPNSNYNGIDEFEYSINDGEANSNVATVKLNVTPVNDLPVATNDGKTTAEDTPVDINIFAIATDIEGLATANPIVINSAPTNGTLTVNQATGVIRYTPSSNYNGTDSFTYQVKDSNGALSNIATIDITVNAINDVPVTGADTGSLVEDDNPIIIDVLANDSDIEGGINFASVSITSNPKPNGTIEVLADGRIQYTPQADFFGTDSFQYTVADNNGGVSVPTTVTVTITPVNDAPIAIADSFTTDEGVAIASINVIQNDTDIDDTLTLDSVIIVQNPTGGTLTLNLDKTLTYTPNVGFNGVDSFTYKVADAAAATSNEAIVTINVIPNVPPVANSDNADVDEDGSVEISVLDNDTDSDGTLNPREVAIVPGSGPDPQKGTVQILTNGNIQYTPKPNFFGSDSFKYTARDDDNSISNEASVTVMINGINDTPTTSGISHIKVIENAPDTVINLYNSFADIEDTDADLTYTIISNTKPSLYTATITDGQLTLNYVPGAKNDQGTVTVRATDKEGAFVETSFVVTVEANTLPTVVGIDDVTVNEDADSGTINLYAAFEDQETPDSQLVYTVVGNDNANVLTATTASDGQLILDYLSNQNGIANITIQATDANGGSATTTFTVVVNAVNDAPTTTGMASFTVVENSPATTIDLVPVFNDIDSSGLTYAIANNTASDLFTTASISNGKLTLGYKPDTIGISEIEMRATDPEGASVTTSFTVTVTDNKPPTVINPPIPPINVLEDADHSTVTLPNYFTDGETPGQLTYALASDNHKDFLTAAIDSNGQLILDYLPNTNGNTTVRIRATDANGGAVETDLAVNIVSVNDSPTKTEIPGITVIENAPDTMIDLYQYFGDVENGAAGLSYEVKTNTNLALFTATPIVDGKLTLDYAPNAEGNSTLTIRATDEAGSYVETSFLVTVEPNTPPTISQPIATVNVQEDAANTLINLYDYFGDQETPDNQLIYTVDNSNANVLTPSISNNGQLILDYLPNANGSANLTVRATDTNGGMAQTTFTVNITAINDKPTASTISNVIVIANSPNTEINLLGVFDDVEDGSAGLQYAIADNSNSTLFSSVNIVNGQLILDYAPNPNGNGTSALKIRAFDQQGEFVDQSFNVIVTSNTLPTTVGISNINVNEDADNTSINLYNAFADQETPDNLLTYTVVSNTHATLLTTAIDSNGQLILDYVPNAYGSANITVRATDANGSSVDTSFTVNVAAVNDTPTVTGINPVVVVENTANTGIDLYQVFHDIEDGSSGLVYAIAGNTNSGLFTNVSISNNGQLTLGYKPNTPGNSKITIRGTDKNNASVETSFDVIVSQNTPPTAIPIPVISVQEDAANTTINLHDYFGDAETPDTLLTYAVVSNLHANLLTTAINNDGQLILDYLSNAYGSASITVRATDTNGGIVETPFTVNVNPVNDAPTATVIPNVEVIENSATTSINLYQYFNDVEDGNSGLTYAIASNSNSDLVPASIGGDGKLTLSYKPNSTGTSKVTIRATDQDNASIETSVNISVFTNTLPLAATIPNVSVQEDAASTTINLYDYFADQETPDHLLTYTVISNSPVGLVNPTIGSNGELILNYLSNANGSANLTVRASDANGGVADSSFTVNIAPINDVPTTIGHQTINVSEDAADTVINLFAVFADVETSDHELVYTLVSNTNSGLFTATSLSSGNLTLDYAPNQSGVAAVLVRAIDQANASIETSFTINVAAANDPPRLVTTLTNPVIAEDTPTSFSIPPNAFVDPDPGNTITYSATLDTGAPLPSWLSFNPATRTFSGTPTNASVGNYGIKVIATDNLAASSSATFTLTVSNVNDTPTVVVAIADQTTLEGNPFQFTIPAGTFSDLDAGDTLNYAAKLASGEALPSWLSFNATSLTFSGTPAAADIGTLSIRVTATDTSQATISDVFDLSIGTSTLELPPTVANPIPDQTAKEGTPFSFIFANQTFNDLNPGDVLTYTARLATGDPLPGWLIFDAANRKFSGTPLNTDVGSLSVTVTATDKTFAKVSDTFNLVVSGVNNPPMLELSHASFAYARNLGAMVIDNGLILSDLDNTSLSSAIVTLLGFIPGQDRLNVVNQFGINGSFNSATGILTLTGIASLANYQTALRSITYSNSGATSGSFPRAVQFKINDGVASSNPVSIQVTFQNNPPIIDLNGSAAGVNFTTSGTAGTSTRIVDPNLTLSDVDNTVLSSALVVISNPIDWIQERLSANTAGTNLIATYNTEAGSLSLKGAAPLATYQQVLRTVTYSNSAIAPDATVRKIVFYVNDGADSSTAAETTLNLIDHGSSNTGAGGTPSPIPGALATTAQLDGINAPASNDTVTSILAYLQQNDTISGGIGIDTFILTDGTGAAIIDVSNATNQISGITPAGTKITNFERFDLSGFTGNATITGSDLWDDLLIGSSGNNTLSGKAGNDTLTSNAGNDILDGGLGNDTLTGGSGDDLYLIDSPGDLIVEDAIGGIDTIQSAINLTLADNLENLTVTGSATTGTGNSLNNTLTGNDLNNTLVGSFGDDVLIGKGAKDKLQGGDGNDYLTGDAGKDKLQGGKGKDSFVLTSRKKRDRDIIKDFVTTDDTILIAKSGFSAKLKSGTVRASEFVIGSGATDKSDRFIYNQNTGALFFDSDGVGGTAQIQIATLSNRTKIVRSDIVVGSA